MKGNRSFGVVIWLGLRPLGRWRQLSDELLGILGPVMVLHETPTPCWLGPAGAGVL